MERRMYLNLIQTNFNKQTNSLVSELVMVTRGVLKTILLVSLLKQRI